MAQADPQKKKRDWAGAVVSLLFLPGSVFSIATRRLCCDLKGIPVYEAKYFEFEFPLGFLRHGEFKNLDQALFVTVVPFVVATLTCAAVTLTASTAIFLLADYTGFGKQILAIWVGLSIGMLSFPTPDDLGGLTEQIISQSSSPLKPVAAIAAGFFTLSALLQRVWFDFFYAVLVSLALPFAYSLFGSG